MRSKQVEFTLPHPPGLLGLKDAGGRKGTQMALFLPPSSPNVHIHPSLGQPSPSLPIKRREVGRWHRGIERGIKVFPNGVKAPVMLTLLVGSVFSPNRNSAPAYAAVLC